MLFLYLENSFHHIETDTAVCAQTNVVYKQIWISQWVRIYWRTCFGLIKRETLWMINLNINDFIFFICLCSILSLSVFTESLFYFSQQCVGNLSFLILETFGIVPASRSRTNLLNSHYIKCYTNLRNHLIPPTLLGLSIFTFLFFGTWNLWRPRKAYFAFNWRSIVIWLKI